MSEIVANYKSVEERIKAACSRSGRSFDDVKLVVVTKKQPASKINEVLAAGAKYLGENYPEQLVLKIPEIDHVFKSEWHMIGHIQSRKIKYIAQYFSVVHSIDDLETASKLNQACESKGITIPILIEVNIAGEISKKGIQADSEKDWDSIVDFIDNIKMFGSIRPVGLMTMPPFTHSGESNRIHFRKCRQLLDHINRNLKVNDFCELSMGTSSDFEIAVEEGATYVRIGEAIMGSRNI